MCAQVCDNDRADPNRDSKQMVTNDSDDGGDADGPGSRSNDGDSAGTRLAVG